MKPWRRSADVFVRAFHVTEPAVTPGNLRTRLSALLCAGFLLAFVSPAASQTSPASSHPRLMLNREGVVRLKERIATVPWIKSAWTDFKVSTDELLNQPVVLPLRGGNWGHNYVCPDHAARLTRGRKIGEWQWEHLCPVGHHILLGDPEIAARDFDGNVIMWMHLNYGTNLTDHGLVYQVTGDSRHARRARELLLGYAARYPTYLAHDNWNVRGSRRPGRGGRVSSQSLTEARWLIEMALGADLVWDTLSDDDKRAIEEKVLRPALNDVVIPQKYGIHNIQCWQNSAIGLVGFLLNDQKLIDLAIHDPVYGYRQQMDKGVSADGLWTEGSIGYHFYAMTGCLPLLEAARNNGINLYGTQFKSMFDGPLALAMPNLTLPNFNDSGLVELSERAELYELGYARYSDAAYAAVLVPDRRGGKLAWLHGATNLVSGNLPARGSRNLAASGYAILQQGEGAQATWIGIKYGTHGGAHGHYDKNGFILYARGEIVAPDVGTHAYASALHSEWDKASLAHNTIVVNEESQQAAQGRCLAFGAERGVDYAITDAGEIYPNVRFIRTAALLTPDVIVFVDQLKADEPKTFDLAYHQAGAWEGLPEGERWLAPRAVAYKHFTGVTARTLLATNLTLRTRIKSGLGPAITLAADDETQVLTGEGVLRTTAERVPMLVQRRTAEKTAFVWAVSPAGLPVTLKTAAVKSSIDEVMSKADAVMVHVGAGNQRWSLLVNPQQHSLRASFPDGHSGETEQMILVR